MKNRLTKISLLLLSLLAFCAALITVSYGLEDTLPGRIVRQAISRAEHFLPITLQHSTKAPDSYLVPTPLPLTDDQAVDLENALNRIFGSEQSSDDGRVEIAQVGTFKQEQIVRTDASSQHKEQPTPSEFAILAATPTPLLIETRPNIRPDIRQSSDEPLDVQLGVAIQNLPKPDEAQLTNNVPPTVPSPVAVDAQAESQNPSNESGAIGFPTIQLPELRLPAIQLPQNAQTAAVEDSHSDGVLQNNSDLVDLQVASAPPVPPPVQPNPPAPSVALTNFSHEWQTWNNCGPATLAMNLSFFGSTLNQADIGASLRPNDDDKNVTPQEMATFAQSRGYHAQLRVNGNSQLMKTLLSNDIPVLIETWMEPDPNDGMGHYRLLTGYDDTAQHWVAFDSYVSHDFVRDGENYEGIILPYEEAAEMWRVFNRTYLLIYPEEKVGVVNAIFGPQLDTQAMWNQALVDLRDEIVHEPQDAFTWFNLGSTLNALSNYVEAAAAFDQARQLGLPWRMLWYQFGPFEAYYHTQRYDEVVALAYATIASTESVEEVYYWKGLGLAATGNPNSAQKAWQQALALNPSYDAARQASESVGQ